MELTCLPTAERGAGDPGLPGIDIAAAPIAAAEAFSRAVHAIAAHRPEAGPALADCLAADPGHVAAHAITGFARLMLARSELAGPAADALGAARSALAARAGGTADERTLVLALGHAVAGEFGQAARSLDAGFADRPGALLPFKLAHGLRFMAGDMAGMLARSTRAVEAGRVSGFVLGCHAFALEEHGLYAEAEAAGHAAVRLTPEDAWGRHAVSHVHEMRGDTEAGIAWLEDSRPVWSGCNNFAFHMAWHLGLLHLERGDHDRVLAVYDAEVRPDQTDDYRDMANAVSLLWRMDRAGIAVASRWRDLADIAHRRREDTTLVFAALHTLCALVALGDDAGAAAMVAALERKAAGSCEQSRLAAEVGVPLASVLTQGHRAGAAIEPLLRDLPRVGGSNAQRDLFLLSLAEAAGRSGDAAGLDRVRALRARLKTEDRLIRNITARAA